MKSGVPTRPYRQRRRAEAAEANTERILDAALELFVERPFEQIALTDVAQRAGVGLQTLVRRVGTKDGLARAVQAHVGPQIGAALGEPGSSDPATVAAAFARQYERFGTIIDRTIRQEDVSPALAAQAAAGREAHRRWIGAAFAGELAALPAGARRRLRARLVGVTGVELWLVLRRDERLSLAATRDTVARLIVAVLSSTDRES